MVILPFLTALGLAIGSASALFESRAQTHLYRSLPGCLSYHKIPTLLPSSGSTFTSAIVPYNLRTPWTPTALAIPENTKQVSAAVRCAARFNVKVAARSGGHSYGAFGLGGQDGSLVVDMKRFKEFSYDEKSGLVEIGPGMRLGDIALKLFENGGRALPHGLCGGVGLGGHALHGGFGFTSRMWGTTLDTIRSLEVVLASGQLVTASAHKNPDLFWALRGAGSSFGIVTKFTLQTLSAPQNGVSFNYTFPSATNPAAKSAIFLALQQFAATQAPPELALRLLVVTEAFPVIASFQITGVYWGTRAAFNTIIAPLLASWPDTVSIITEANYLDSLVGFSMGAPLAQPEPYNVHDTFFVKSIVAPTILNNASLTSFFTFLASPEATTNAPVLYYIIADLYGGANSKISSYPDSYASYAGRDALFTYQLYSIPYTLAPPYPTQAGIAFMNNMVDSIQRPMPGVNFQAYPNYVDPSLAGEEAQALYWGDQLARLKRLKARWDSRGLFTNPQGVTAERP